MRRRRFNVGRVIVLSNPPTAWLCTGTRGYRACSSFTCFACFTFSLSLSSVDSTSHRSVDSSLAAALPALLEGH